jgi:hypothetical protein
MSWNVDGLDAHDRIFLKHLESNVEGLQQALVTGYKMAVSGVLDWM